MKFSEYYKIKKIGDWFDPIMNIDSKFFIDPFLIYQSSHPNFKDCHQKTISFFDDCFAIAAKSTRDESDVRHILLLHSLLFPEAEELCLGYSELKGIRGTGSGKIYAKIILEAIYNTLNMGIGHLDHFESLALFSEGMGCDRISDATATILKKELILYTQEICRSLNVPMKKFNLKQFEYDLNFHKWNSRVVELPENPHYKNLGVILVPESFLSNLPTINTDSFWDYAWDNKNEEIRTAYNIDIKSNVNKEEIIKIAREQREWIKEYEKQKETNKQNGYDFKKDKNGLYGWYDIAKKYSSLNPMKLEADSDAEFNDFISAIISMFDHFIKYKEGYKLLWDDKFTKSKSEEAAQLLFYGMAEEYCRVNDIDMTREAKTGKGLVDFKFSRGYLRKVLLEIKLAHNSKFWRNIKKQLQLYLKASKIVDGTYLVVCFNEKDLKSVEGIEEIVEKLSEEYSINLRIAIIDASIDKKTASKV